MSTQQHNFRKKFRHPVGSINEFPGNSARTDVIGREMYSDGSSCAEVGSGAAVEPGSLRQKLAKSKSKYANRPDYPKGPYEDICRNSRLDFFDLCGINPVIYSPMNYFTVGNINIMQFCHRYVLYAL